MLGRGVADRLAGDRPQALFHPEVAETARRADLFLLNLECCISERGSPWPDPVKPFFFRAPPAGVEALVHLGVDCVSLGITPARASARTESGNRSNQQRNQTEREKRHGDIHAPPFIERIKAVDELMEPVDHKRPACTAAATVGSACAMPAGFEYRPGKQQRQKPRQECDDRQVQRCIKRRREEIFPRPRHSFR
jgi:hypothetical protein